MDPFEETTGGNGSSGFRVRATDDNILRLECFGVWDVGVAEAYREVLTRYMQAMKDAGATWWVCADIQNFPPQRDDVAQVHQELMALAVQWGMAAAASVVSSAMTQLQIQRLADHGGIDVFAFHQDEESARSWLLRQG